ncbi:hypothetical protein F2P81_016564 [Scophthalmus maximus]|uniref:C-type lectin domain-containing protein n=1 Tax=Scophthalmus maximus TaxID=52904 RepID=A0A6A4SHM5_SCOMX|nr:hypothetical protein F2P81_016564 [Scophthalmus maximus]
MCPVLLHFLLLAALNSDSAADPQGNNAGLKFIVAFPENIAHYYPIPPQNKIQITALHSNTQVTFKMFTYGTSTETLSAGQSKEFLPDVKLELKKEEISSETLTITSTEKIIVHAISLKHNSVQTALVIPTDQLGKEYLVPPVPRIPGTNDNVTLDVTERRPFRLVIISGDQPTKVTVEGAETREVSLRPQQVAQILLQEAAELRAVRADQPVAVLLTHSCAIRLNCTCGLLLTRLSPATQEQLRFFIPPFLAKNASGETFLLLSKEDSTTIEAFDPNSPLVETTGSVVLYRPGFLLTLIPEKDFASCFVVSRIQGMQSFAVIMVHKDFTDGVRIRKDPLGSPDWQELRGTEFVSTAVELDLETNVIWHTSSKMAVYFVGKHGTALYGNPAPIVSRTPDFRGCVLAPEVVKIGEVVDGWRESVKYCRDNDLQLVSFSRTVNVMQIHKELVQVKNDSMREAWIGMRRSSQTGEWYWLNNDPVTDTNWEEGEPGTEDDGQCAIMSLESGKDFGWRDEDCCKAALPVCYRRPVLFPL